MHRIRFLALLLMFSLLPGLGMTGEEEIPIIIIQDNDPINRRISPNNAQTLDYMPEAARARTDTLVIGVNDLLGSFSPFWAQTQGDNYAASLMFDELLFMNNNGEMGAGAAAVSTSADGKIHTFTIQDTVKYADGTPVRSDDFINALYLLLLPDYDGVYDIRRAGIVGAKAYLSGEAEAISGIVRVSDSVFSVTLESANPGHLVFFAIPALRVDTAGSMQRPQGAPPAEYAAFYKQALADAREADLVSMAYGQYILTDYTPGGAASFVKNEAYWRGEPNITTLQLLYVPVEGELDAIMSGQVDIISMLGSVESVDTVSDYETSFINLSTWTGDVIGYLGMDLNNPVFADLNMRQALAIGFDREAARSKRIERYGSVPGVFLFDSFDVSASRMLGEQYAYDLARAAALLDAIDWAMDADGLRYRDGQPLSLTVTYNSPNPVMDVIVQQMTEDYRLLGIELKTEQVSFETLLEKIDAGTCELYLQARKLPASAAVASDLFAGDSPMNFTGYQSEMTDRLLGMADASGDEARATVIYEMLYQEIYLNLPIIPLYRRSEFLLVNARVMNVNITTSHDIVADAYRYFLTDTLRGQW